MKPDPRVSVHRKNLGLCSGRTRLQLPLWTRWQRSAEPVRSPADEGRSAPRPTVGMGRRQTAAWSRAHDLKTSNSDVTIA